jgi:hypothetical protein
MWPSLKNGTAVKTIRPEIESKDWAAEALECRRWGVVGKIVGYSDSHGLCYRVEHADGTDGWYESRELVLL